VLPNIRFSADVMRLKMNFGIKFILQTNINPKKNMLAGILIAISFSLGFFVESMIGFGGALIAYSILAFFMDLKDMILAGLYIGTLSSIRIIYSDRKSFDKEIFKSAIPLCAFGTILGAFLFLKLSAALLSLIFGILLIALSIKALFFDRVIFPKIFKSKLIFIGGIAQGIFGTGGPFWVSALQKDFKNKSNLRTTIAVFFVSFNLIRCVQFYLQNQLEGEFFAKIWWVIIPVFIAIKLGHMAHLKISESTFRKGIAIITGLAGLKFLSKFFY
jgi:uncharacterized membrane protein YfcA